MSVSSYGGHELTPRWWRVCVASWKDVALLQGGPKNGYPVLFWDNFGNSAPILTTLSLLQAEIYGA